MPLEPVTEYDQARYPTFEEMVHHRRDFLRCVGRAAIAAAFGPHVLGCSAGGGTQPSQRPVPPMLAGAAPPPHWPGPRGVIVAGGPVEFTYADGATGWVVVAVVFDESNKALESALVSAETRIASVVRKRLGGERSGFLADVKRAHAAEAAILQAIQTTVGVHGLLSVTLAEVDAEASRAASPGALSSPPRPERAPELAPPAAAMAGRSEPVRHLPRAGTKCPIHPSGCRRSEASGG